MISFLTFTKLNRPDRFSYDYFSRNLLRLGQIEFADFLQDVLRGNIARPCAHRRTVGKETKLSFALAC